MTHEIHNPMAVVHRDLPGRDGSRYQTLRLVVQRQGADSALVSLIFQNAGGHRLAGTRLGMCTISTVDETGVHLGPDQVMARALRAVLQAPGR